MADKSARSPAREFLASSPRYLLAILLGLAYSLAHAVEPATPVPVGAAKPETKTPEKKPAPRPWGVNPSFSDGNQKVSVFGIAGEGSRYIYVFDRSASMSLNKGRPLAAAKAELTKSLQAITSVQQFQVIFYNERPRIIESGTGAPRFLYGDDRGHRDAAKFIDNIDAEGGSAHYEALLMALNLGPDVVFFLTDGGEPALEDAEFARLQTRAERAGAKIHTIEFGAGPGGMEHTFVKRIAEENNGKYVYVDITKLPQP